MTKRQKLFYKWQELVLNIENLSAIMQNDAYITDADTLFFIGQANDTMEQFKLLTKKTLKCIRQEKKDLSKRD